jgi:DNA polymerase III alpha subunit (gram-positive type)
MLKTQITECLKTNLEFPESKNLQQRGIADKIEDACNEIIKENFENVKDARSNRSIEDISIGNTYVDHKSSDEAKDFKMPNMISITRLKKLDRELIYNFIIYNSKEQKIIKTFALNVYELNWEHLSIQGLGNGQLQITNMESFLESPSCTLTKEEWLLRLKQEAIKFCINQQKKFAKQQKEWQ